MAWEKDELRIIQGCSKKELPAAEEPKICFETVCLVQKVESIYEMAKTIYLCLIMETLRWTGCTRTNPEETSSSAWVLQGLGIRSQNPIMGIRGLFGFRFGERDGLTEFERETEIER